MIVPLAFIVCGILLLVVGFMADVWMLRIIAGATIGAAGLPLIVILCRNYWSYGAEERRVCDEARIHIMVFSMWQSFPILGTIFNK